MVKFVVTGFGKFHGVEVNPSEVLVTNLTDSALSKELGIITAVVEVSIEGADSALAALHKREADQTNTLSESGENNGASPSNRRDESDDVIWLHIGVHPEQAGFCLEKVAWNEASFRVADQRGAQPQKQLILDAPTAQPSLRTSINVEDLAHALRSAEFSVETSEDPGRYLCNYIYYRSLEHSRKHHRSYSLFLHTPPFEHQNFETQVSFLRTLLSFLPKYLPAPQKGNGGDANSVKSA